MGVKKDIATLSMNLSSFGKVVVLKKGKVFTLLMVGQDLTSVNNLLLIQKLVLSHVGDEYPFIEVLKNSDSFLLMILATDKKDEWFDLFNQRHPDEVRIIMDEKNATNKS